MRKLVPFIQPHPLSFAFAQQLPQRGRRGRFAPERVQNGFCAVTNRAVRALTYGYIAPRHYPGITDALFFKPIGEGCRGCLAQRLSFHEVCELLTGDGFIRQQVIRQGLQLVAVLFQNVAALVVGSVNQVLDLLVDGACHLLGVALGVLVPFQMVMICLMIANFSQLQILTNIIMWIALILTVVSLIDYLVKNKDVMKNTK